MRKEVYFFLEPVSELRFVFPFNHSSCLQKRAFTFNFFLLILLPSAKMSGRGVVYKVLRG